MKFLRIPRGDILREDGTPSDREAIFNIESISRVYVDHEPTPKRLTVTLATGKEYAFFVGDPTKYTEQLGGE